MTPEEICALITDHPSMFEGLFDESKRAGVEQSATVCLNARQLHLEDRCIGDICSVKPSSMKCETGEAIAHVHTHLEDEQMPDKLSLADMLLWFGRAHSVDCVTHSKGTACYTSPGNPSVLGVSRYMDKKKVITAEDMEEILALVELLPDERSAMIAWEEMLINEKIQTPDTFAQYWNKYDYMTGVSKIRPCRTEKYGYAKTFTAEDARQIGESLGIDWNKFDVEQYRKGLEVELEHKDVTGGDKIMTGKIALTHLNEMPDYYTRLQKMEASHRGSDPAAIAIGEKLGLAFDGMQNDSYQFTVVRGPDKAKGITFYVTDLARVESRLKEKFKEFGI